MKYATLLEFITADETPTWVRGLITLLKVDVEKTLVDTDTDYAVIYPAYKDEINYLYKKQIVKRT